MPAIGITGGISTGKTTFVNCLRELLPEAKFFDADAMARELTHHDQAVLAEIRDKFGNDIFDAKNFFDDPYSPIPPLRLNQYGGTLGGPVRGDPTRRVGPMIQLGRFAPIDVG